jgi:sacsin
MALPPASLGEASTQLVVLEFILPAQLTVQVYNWTDSPSIISRDRLLILDPHHRWTKKFANPGGPVYNFVQYAKEGSMRDQMAAFSTVMEDIDRPFQGTIIRIPLRNSEQAPRSDISKQEA